MQETIFLLLLGFATVFLWKTISQNDLFFPLLSLAVCFMLWGSLQAEGISFVNGVNLNTGAFTYLTIKGSNDGIINGLSYAFFGLGMLSMAAFWIYLGQRKFNLRLGI